jgi:AAA domain
MKARDLAVLLADGGPVRVSGGRYTLRCPAHDDSTPSLSVSDGEKDVVLTCFGGCTNDEVLAARGLTWADVLEPRDQLPNLEPTIYAYTDEVGQPLFEVVRGEDKHFRQRRPDPNQESGYQWNLHGVRRVLYHLPDVIAAVQGGHEVWVTEGEKDADAVRAEKVCATTMSGGAGKWRPEYNEFLVDASVTIWSDADDRGRVHARAVREHLLPVVNRVRVVESAYGKDAYDHLGHGLSLDDVLVTDPYDEPEVEDMFERLFDFVHGERPHNEWVIRTLLRENEVVVITGFEGTGKSSLLKQIAVCAAVGVHPFMTAVTLDPCRVLFIDCENNRADCMDDFDRLVTQIEREELNSNPEMFVHVRNPMALDQPAGVAWLRERVLAHEPDLLVIGPLYHLLAKDMSSGEDGAQALIRAIDMVHQVSKCAVVIEHHSPHKPQGEHRSVRPYGSSLLMRWPSFGFGLMPSGGMQEPFEFLPWRGVRRRGRTWPSWVRQAGTQDDGWFWEEAEPPEK